MKAQIALSINQMKGLEALGVDISDASLMWVNNMFSGRKQELILFSHTLYLIKPLDPTPAYTLEDMLLKLSFHPLSHFLEKSDETPIDTAYSLLLWAASHDPESIKTIERHSK